MKLRRIKTVGIELEGAWRRSRIRRHSCSMVSDGSVNVIGAVDFDQYDDDLDDDDDAPAVSSRLWVQGEIRSDVMASWEEIVAFMDVHYPQKGNASCGLHVHMGFGQNLLRVTRLGDPEYKDRLYYALKQWATLHNERRLLSRLAGSNSYCRDVFEPEAGFLNRHSDVGRYAGINFFAWLSHRTIEVRVLPYFETRRRALDAIELVLHTTETWLHDGIALDRRSGHVVLPSHDDLGADAEYVTAITIQA